MKRTRRIITIFELLEASGSRGMSREEILRRLSERGVGVEMRQLERDLTAMRTTLDFPIASSDDVTDEQAASGARVVYFINRIGRDSRALLSSGKSMAWFESVGGAIWGKPIEEGHVVLHHERGNSVQSIVRTLPGRFPSSRLLYLGQHLFIHFFLEVSTRIAADIDVRIGRVNAATPRGTRKCGEREVCIGFGGYPTMSRLLGPQAGHVRLSFPAQTTEVLATDLSRVPDSTGALHATMLCDLDPSDADRTPIVMAPTLRPRTRTFRLKESGQLSFGGALLILMCPSKSNAASCLI